MTLGRHPHDCIRSSDRADCPDDGLAILYGTLAPESAVVKTAGIGQAFKERCGTNFVFEVPASFSKAWVWAWATKSPQSRMAGLVAGRPALASAMFRPRPLRVGLSLCFRLAIVSASTSPTAASTSWCRQRHWLNDASAGSRHVESSAAG